MVNTALVICSGVILATAAGLSSALLLSRRFVVVTVRGDSMEPAFSTSDQVLVNRDWSPEVGSVVVVEQPASGERVWPRPPFSGAGSSGIRRRVWMIKRIAAVEGQPLPRLGSGEGETLRVPRGSLFLLGDNPEASADSRNFGCIPAERVLGVAVRRLG